MINFFTFFKEASAIPSRKFFLVVKKILSGFLFLALAYSLTTFTQGCGQIGFPTGGAKDTLAPTLVNASPQQGALNVASQKIVLQFNEYVEIADAQNNVLISPLPASNPSINYNLKTVTIRLRDSLLPNTTYSIRFGNAIKDVNEGNVFKNFTYSFSTGSAIDSASISGRVVLAESGLTDSTIAVLLYKNLADSAVERMRPHYLTRLSGDGSFTFTHLAPGTYAIYALKDGDGNKYYNSKTELFAFHTAAIEISNHTEPVTLYAYALEKESDLKKPTSVLKPAPEKQLKFTSNLAGNLDFKDTLKINFNNPITKWDSSAILLTDTSFAPIAQASVTMDSIAKTLRIYSTWQAGMPYCVVMPKAAFQDAAGHTLIKTDTLRFKVKDSSEYARIQLRFTDIDLSKNPVLQFISGTDLKAAFPLQATTWSHRFFAPGEYQIRILYDEDKDGRFTPGNYIQKRQPEKAITLPQKLSLRANWDNEREIKLQP